MYTFQETEKENNIRKACSIAFLKKQKRNEIYCEISNFRMAEKNKNYIKNLNIIEHCIGNQVSWMKLKKFLYLERGKSIEWPHCGLSSGCETNSLFFNLPLL